jgi:hypothetical protein
VAQLLLASRRMCSRGWPFGALRQGVTGLMCDLQRYGSTIASYHKARFK